MQRKKRSSLVSNYKLVLLMDAAGKCFDEKECYRNKMKRRRVFLKRPSKGKIVCPPAPRWELGAATVQQGTPTCGHTGMELVHERCPASCSTSESACMSSAGSGLVSTRSCPQSRCNGLGTLFLDERTG